MFIPEQQVLCILGANANIWSRLSRLKLALNAKTDLPELWRNGHLHYTSVLSLCCHHCHPDNLRFTSLQCLPPPPPPPPTPPPISTPSLCSQCISLTTWWPALCASACPREATHANTVSGGRCRVQVGRWGGVGRFAAGCIYPGGHGCWFLVSLGGCCRGAGTDVLQSNTGPSTLRAWEKWSRIESGLKEFKSREYNFIWVQVKTVEHYILLNFFFTGSAISIWNSKYLRNASRYIKNQVMKYNKISFVFLFVHFHLHILIDINTHSTLSWRLIILTCANELNCPWKRVHRNFIDINCNM